MGYFDISIEGSDLASDVVSDINKAIAEKLSKEMKEKHTSCNTSGVVNVALWFESCVAPAIEGWSELCENPLYGIAVECRDLLTAEDIKNASKKSNWDDEQNRSYHLSRYRQLKKSLDRFIAHYERRWS